MVFDFVYSFIMLTAINFDDEFFLKATKIYYCHPTLNPSPERGGKF